MRTAGSRLRGRAAARGAVCAPRAAARRGLLVRNDPSRLVTLARVEASARPLDQVGGRPEDETRLTRAKRAMRFVLPIPTPPGQSLQSDSLYKTAGLLLCALLMVGGICRDAAKSVPLFLPRR